MSRFRYVLSAAAVIAGPVAPLSAQSATAHTAHAPARAPELTDVVPLYGDLGSHRYAITTRNPQTQRYFDQGLRLTWGFNHPEALRSFQEAERLDPLCAMCAWGIAMVLGPNINMGMDSLSGAQAYQAIQRAKKNAARASSRERALIEALAQRYTATPSSSRAALDSAYANAMRAVADQFGDDHESQVLYADALMNLSPWNYWTPKGSMRPATSQIIARLERVMQANPQHPGACHLFIHVVEAQDPKRALPCAERLASLMPGAGHIVHMPAHIYIRVGRYADAIAANHDAVHADGAMFESPGVARRGIYANGYFPHNYHFMTFAATMAGNSKLAIEAARETAKRLDAAAVKAVPWVESVTPIVPLTLVTFGKWSEVLAEPLPNGDVPFQLAMSWYARGVAHAALSDTVAARRDMNELIRNARNVEGDNATALQIAVFALEGEIALRSGNTKRAITAFRKAVELEDSLTYNEPPTWYYPMRHSLGKALLAAQEHREAERVFRQDLERFPENGWALFGLSEALARQNRQAEAGKVSDRLARAWKGADIRLTSSRF